MPRSGDAMLDWWPVDGGRWGVKNLSFKVEVRPESVTWPDPAEGYSEADIYAFDGGDWQFAEVTVVPMTADLTDLVSYRAYLIGVDWGQLADHRVDRPEVTEDQAKGLVLEIVTRMRKDGLPVLTEDDSEFGPAPF
jgi:hypothetical protein